MVQTIELGPPSWESAVLIYMAVLENPKASEDAKQGAREDILRLARSVDSRANK